MNSPDKRLLKAEEDFKNLKKFLNKEQGARKTKRIETLLGYVKEMAYSPYSAIAECYRFYSLKPKRYPDMNIEKKVKSMMYETFNLFSRTSEDTLQFFQNT